MSKKEKAVRIGMDNTSTKKKLRSSTEREHEAQLLNSEQQNF